MNLEATVKYHFPKTANFEGMPPATKSDVLTGTDQMAAMGMVQSIAPMGFSAFMGKVGVSKNDAERAVTLLKEYALKTCDKVAALRKLDSDIKPAVVQTLATYAYLDYCRAASTKKPCECCNGEGFIETEVFSTKSHLPMKSRELVKASCRMRGEGSRPSTYEVHREIREKTNVLCKECNGKGVLSTACSDCRGRGEALDREETKRQGVPVKCKCKRCSGRGFERILSTDAHRAVCVITEAITLDTWKKSVKPFYDGLSTKLEIEEEWANSALNKVTQ
jgi:hypothetical protein